MPSPLAHPSLMDCRRVFLRDYEVHIRIGAHDFEKLAPQRVLINVDLYVPLADSTPTHDTLDEVVDYDFIRRSVSERVERGHIQLQETLVDDLASVLLAHPQVRAVCVSTQKPDVYPDCRSVGVEVFRLKPAA
jgi:dihydroneopterin aldolase